jgi:hypothetical protein
MGISSFSSDLLTEEPEPEPESEPELEIEVLSGADILNEASGVLDGLFDSSIGTFTPSYVTDEEEILRVSDYALANAGIVGVEITLTPDTISIYSAPTSTETGELSISLRLTSGDYHLDYPVSLILPLSPET